MKPTAKPIEIFRAGTHTASSGRQVTITTADLTFSAAAYDKQLRQAPHVIGHPKTDDPAFGWVDRLEVKGDVLLASGELQPEFAELVQSGAYRNRSAAFYAPNDPGNPVPGTWYLRHVGWLGARQPAVPGLKPVEFAAGEAFVEFADWNGLTIAKLFRNVREFMIAQFGQEKADAVTPADMIDQLTIEAAQPDCDDPTTNPGAVPAFSQPGVTMTTQEQQLAAERQKLEQERTEFAQRQQAVRMADITAFVDGLVKAGKLATGNKAPMIAFMGSLAHGDDATFEFAQADGTKAQVEPTTWFKAFLTQLPQLVPLGERAPHKPGTEFAETDKAYHGLDPSKVYAIHNKRG